MTGLLTAFFAALMTVSYTHLDLYKRQELDRDDGRTVYEVEFRSGRVEYSYDINASTGAVTVSYTHLVDEEAAEVVKSIYHWFVNEGYSKRGIAQRLNQMGEPNPEAYKKQKGLKYNNPNSSKNDGLWSASTIARILQNKV